MEGRKYENKTLNHACRMVFFKQAKYFISDERGLAEQKRKEAHTARNNATKMGSPAQTELPITNNYLAKPYAARMWRSGDFSNLLRQ